MVCKHWEGQSVECLEDSLWRQHIPVQGILICPELWHLNRWQVYCDRLWWQEGHCIWSDLLEQTALYRSMLMLRNSRLFLHLPSLTQTAWMLPAAPGWMGRKFGSARLKLTLALLWPWMLCPSALPFLTHTTNTCTGSAVPKGTKKKIMSCCFSVCWIFLFYSSFLMWR